MQRRSSILALFLLLSLASWSVAQDATEVRHSFGCSSTKAESAFSASLNQPSKLSVAAVTSADEIAKAGAGVARTTYSKIDSAKYSINRVDFFVHQDRPQKPETQYQPISIYFKLSSGQQSSWWKVVEDSKDPSDEALLSADLPNTDDGKMPSPISILPATGDRGIPLFDLQWSRWENGQWTINLEAHLLLDLRSPEPKVVADLSCNSFTAFGVCGIWDAQYQDRNNYECDWSGADNDFRCESTEWNENRGKRQNKAWFQLLSGKDLPFAVAAGSPATLQQFAELAERDPNWRTRRAELPGLGKTSELLRVSAAQGRVVHIFGTYGGADPYDPSFFYVILTKDAPELGFIPSLSLFADDPDDKIRHRQVEFQRGVSEQKQSPLPTNELPSGEDLSFSVKQIFATPLTRVYQITAREDEARKLYWLAIDDQQADGTTRFGMTRLASTSASYAGCARYRSEDSAAKITLLKERDFRALVSVEPAHLSSEAAEGFIPPDPDNGDKPEDQCPYEVHAIWNHHEWTTDEAKVKCAATFSPRNVAIADDGTLTASPALVATPDSQ